LVPPAAAFAPVKLGYVDFQKIAQESKVALKAKNSITASGEKLKKQLTAKGKKLEALKKTLESQAKQMNQLEQEAKGKEFQAKVKEYQEALQSAEKEMAKQEESVTRKLIEQVSQVVKAYGEQNRYTLILSTKDLLYSDGNHPLDDVTAEVIRILDK
jgi:outer membrane protein